MKSLRHATLRQLQIFETAAGNLSFARAAEQLHLTQPAISMQIAQLELSAGAALFERLGKKLFLTPTGTELLTHVRRISQTMREAGRSEEHTSELQSR